MSDNFELYISSICMILSLNKLNIRRGLRAFKISINLKPAVLEEAGKDAAHQRNRKEKKRQIWPCDESLHRWPHDGENSSGARIDATVGRDSTGVTEKFMRRSARRVFLNIWNVHALTYVSSCKNTKHPWLLIHTAGWWKPRLARKI